MSTTPGTPVMYFNDANSGNPFNPATYPAIVYAGAGTATGFDATLVVTRYPSRAACAMRGGHRLRLAVGWRRRRNASAEV